MWNNGTNRIVCFHCNLARPSSIPSPTYAKIQKKPHFGKSNPHQFYNQRVNTLRVSHYFQYTRPDFSQHSTPRYTVYHATRRQARSSCRRTSSEFRRNSSRRFVPEYESTSGSVAAVMGPFLSSRVTQPSSTSEQSGHDTYFVGGLQSKSSAD